MALNISGYVDPGVYTAEVVVPGGVSIATVPLTVGLIGIANRNKRATNEAVYRGLVSDEALTVSSTPGAHDATLVKISNRKTANLVVSKDGTVIDSALTSFRPASVTGPVLTTLDFSTNNKISLALDGKQAVTISITDGGSDSTTVTGSLIAQVASAIVSQAAVTPAEIASAINMALGHANATALGYGPGYGAVATVSGGQITLASPSSTPTSDVRLFQAYPGAQDQTVAIFGIVAPFQALSSIRIDNSAWSSGAAWLATYVATNKDTDSLASASIQTLVRVGSYANVTSFKENTDFSRSVQILDWSLDTAGVFTSSVAAATHNISTNDTVLLALDGKPAATIDLNGLASPPPGYANPVSAASATPAEIANNINAVLAAHASYGPIYRAVASVTGVGPASKLVLTSPVQGLGSFVQIAAPTSLSASTTLFGLGSSQMPYSVSGTGTRPGAGAVYYATYDFTRPSDDYNLPKRYYTPDSLYADVGFPTSTNQLAIAGSIAFENGAPSVIVVQVNDSTFSGAPTQSEFLAAFTATTSVAAITEYVALSTNLGVQVDLLNHVTAQNSPTEKNFCRGWFGMARGTLIGDKDTPDTFIYRSVRTLQVSGDSPARGRLILVAPASITRTVTREDGSVSDVALDGSYAAAAIASRMTAFTSPSDVLIRKNISGFKIENFPTFLKAERALLASNGVTVITLDAGRLTLLDPMSTEGGGGKLIQFSEISASTQKDAVTTSMQQIMDANLIGVVPSDLASFVITIKTNIASALVANVASGAIGPFVTSDGVSRDIDMSKDIQVFQDKGDKTKYYFRYFFNLRYPAKRFMGEYSVDNPFWNA